MKQIILGTAGHIDHGKTTLIKALTGINTDRLKEEQARGITIELGFAFLDLPSGQHLGIVDVPGHEKFVKNMVAGASGIDIVTLVIAADEGVMPQTREHMEICSLLGIQHGFVVLTKTDMVDEEWLELVTEDVRGFIAGTFLEDADIVPLSATTGNGIEAFVETLDKYCTRIPGQKPGGLFRLPVDRVFTMKGFGTVITGTLISGLVRVGDNIMIYPSGTTSRVRGLQVHNKGVDEAAAGMRTAINFQGLERTDVNRGDILSSVDAMTSSYMLDVSFDYLSSNKKPLKNRTQIRFHAGTSEIFGILVLLEAEELAPGETTVAQVRMESPMVLVKGDRFVIRSYSPVRTIGGGQILNPIPVKHKSFRPEVVEGLKGLIGGSAEDIIDFHVKEAGYRGVRFSDLKLMVNIPDRKLDNHLNTLMSSRSVIQADKENRVYIHAVTADRVKQEMIGHLGRYHKAHPLKPGMLKEELKSKFPGFAGGKLFTLVLNQQVKEGAVVSEEKTVRLAAHKISLAVDQSDIREKILKTYSVNGLQPPYFKELVKTMDVDPGVAKDVLMLLVDEGRVVKVKDELYFYGDAVAALKQRLVEFLEANEEITTPQFKEMTGASRKYVIPLIEHFDSKNVTIRIGDIRKLRKR